MAGEMMGFVLAMVGPHHGEADPTLLQWIMRALDHILIGGFGLSELTIVVGIGSIIIAIPALIVISYWAGTRRAQRITSEMRVSSTEVSVSTEGDE